ncbi:MAG TPA: hypothetical protein VF794_33690 [Archangium sp.]
MLPILVALVFACACEPESPAAPPSPRILSISPATQSSQEAKTVTVQLDVDPRFLVNYGERSVEQLDQPTLRIGTQAVPLDTYLGYGQYQGIVPPGIAVGTYDIQVLLPDGREASLPKAYEVKPSFSYWIESIDNQIEGQPFTITIHASGTNAEQFEGTVTVSVIKGQGGNATLFSIQSGPFANGLRRQQLSIDTPGSVYLVQVDDADPNSSASYSNAFRVDPKN